MGKFLDRLRRGSAFHSVEVDGDGFSLVRTDTGRERFDRLVRDLVDHAGEGYAVFPSTDPAHGSRYERVFILPIE